MTAFSTGIVVGIGAGQQSRVDCTKLAGAKLDTWWLRRHGSVRNLPFSDEVRRQERINWEIRFIDGDMDPAETRRFRAALTSEPAEPSADESKDWIGRLDRVALASDGYIPFRDNIDQAARHGVCYIADPGGSNRNEEVEAACAEHNITLITTGVRLFLHCPPAFGAATLRRQSGVGGHFGVESEVNVMGAPS